MKNKTIRIALTKGRLENKTVDLLDKIGYDVSELRDKGRRLILNIPGENIEVVLAKAADVITYVEHGVCDIGVVGKDTIMEQRPRIRQMQVRACRKEGQQFLRGIRDQNHRHKVPGSHPRILRE